MDEAVLEAATCAESVTTGKVPLRPGLLFWTATHKGCYFWVRSAFQIFAFSLFIVTLVMLYELKSAYWQSTIYLLVLIHSIDMFSFSLDLVSFTCRNVNMLWYKIALDVLSFSLSLFMQTYFAMALQPETEAEQLTYG